MAYLNDDYTGGATRFQDAGAQEALRGAPGSILVFNHDIEHEGLAVETGRKYILRTDSTWLRVCVCMCVLCVFAFVFRRACMD